MKRYLTILACLFCLQTLAADSTHTKTFSILPVPAFGYSPETRTYIGAVTLFTINPYKDSLTRTSNAKLEFNYTWNKQIIIETGWNYFFKEEKLFTKGLVQYSKFPDRYWGIGNNTAESNELLYSSNRIVADAYGFKRIGKGLFTGPNVKYISYTNVSADTVIPYPELKSNSSFGIGYSVVKDTRNNLLNATEGVYLNLQLGYVFQQQYTEALLDARYYKTWDSKYTLATRFVSDMNFGNVPFYDMAYLGGDKFVRGYYYGRYRDKQLSTLQTEFRFKAIWRFGAAVFGGISQVYPNYSAFAIGNVKYNYGGGIRFEIDRKEHINLRLDYAVGEGGNNGFYISFGESF